MRIDEAFPGNYVKAEQLTAPIEVVIDYVDVHKFEDGDKPVVFFRGKKAGVKLGRGRFQQLVTLTQQEDSDDWVGHPVVLTREPCSVPGYPWQLKFERSKHDKPDATPADNSDIPF